MDDKKLFQLAQEQTKHSYVPYSKFNVGAALLTAGGEVYTGSNVESASYGATICAERSALVSAISAGEREFRKMAVASISGDFTYPCGICRQLLYEFAPDLEIIVGNAEGVLRKHNLRELLPYGFNQEELNKGK
jgi:cytidine deaminase